MVVFRYLSLYQTNGVSPNGPMIFCGWLAGFGYCEVSREIYDPSNSWYAWGDKHPSVRQSKFNGLLPSSTISGLTVSTSTRLTSFVSWIDREPVPWVNTYMLESVLPFKIRNQYSCQDMDYKKGWTTQRCLYLKVRSHVLPLLLRYGSDGNNFFLFSSSFSWPFKNQGHRYRISSSSCYNSGPHMLFYLSIVPGA